VGGLTLVCGYASGICFSVLSDQNIYILVLHKTVFLSFLNAFKSYLAQPNFPNLLQTSIAAATEIALVPNMPAFNANQQLDQINNQLQQLTAQMAALTGQVAGLTGQVAALVVQVAQV
jgi:hypothetical protein